MEVPMLDEEEYKVVDELYSQAVGNTREYRVRNGLPLSNVPIEELFVPVRNAYKKMTGMDESNHNAIMHHRISIYGEPCKNCGKPLRTPKASFCAACGQVKD
jgi:hypothetical protein